MTQTIGLLSSEREIVNCVHAAILQDKGSSDDCIQRVTQSILKDARAHSFLGCFFHFFSRLFGLNTCVETAAKLALACKNLPIPSGQDAYSTINQRAHFRDQLEKPFPKANQYTNATEKTEKIISVSLFRHLVQFTELEHDLDTVNRELHEELSNEFQRNERVERDFRDGANRSATIKINGQTMTYAEIEEQYGQSDLFPLLQTLAVVEHEMDGVRQFQETWGELNKFTEWEAQPKPQMKEIFILADEITVKYTFNISLNKENSDGERPNIETHSVQTSYSYAKQDGQWNRSQGKWTYLGKTALDDRPPALASAAKIEAIKKVLTGPDASLVQKDDDGEVFTPNSLAASPRTAPIYSPRRKLANENVNARSKTPSLLARLSRRKSSSRVAQD